VLESLRSENEGGGRGVRGTTLGHIRDTRHYRDPPCCTLRCKPHTFINHIFRGEAEHHIIVRGRDSAVTSLRSNFLCGKIVHTRIYCELQYQALSVAQKPTRPVVSRKVRHDRRRSDGPVGQSVTVGNGRPGMTARQIIVSESEPVSPAAT
jgi:hypothetical protein